jgi:hypothetical protein
MGDKITRPSLCKGIALLTGLYLGAALRNALKIARFLRGQMLQTDRFEGWLINSGSCRIYTLFLVRQFASISWLRHATPPCDPIMPFHLDFSRDPRPAYTVEAE